MKISQGDRVCSVGKLWITRDYALLRARFLRRKGLIAISCVAIPYIRNFRWNATHGMDQCAFFQRKIFDSLHLNGSNNRSLRFSVNSQHDRFRKFTAGATKVECNVGNQCLLLFVRRHLMEVTVGVIVLDTSKASLAVLVIPSHEIVFYDR